jgi:hypothetical protein
LTAKASLIGDQPAVGLAQMLYQLIPRVADSLDIPVQ